MTKKTRFIIFGIFALVVFNLIGMHYLPQITHEENENYGWSPPPAQEFQDDGQPINLKDVAPELFHKGK